MHCCCEHAAHFPPGGDGAALCEKGGKGGKGTNPGKGANPGNVKPVNGERPLVGDAAGGDWAGAGGGGVGCAAAVTPGPAGVVGDRRQLPRMV